MDSRAALGAKSYSTGLPSATTELRLRLPATAPSASILRNELADWLRRIGTRASVIFDLELACTEVLTIIVAQYGSRSALVVEVEGTVSDMTATIAVREFGLCQQPNHSRPTLDQTLSLSLIEAMTDSIHIYDHTHGRTFSLQRRI